GDFDAVLNAFDPNIEWVEPDGYFPGAGGVHNGREAVARVLSLYPETWEDFALEPDEFIDAGEYVVVLGTQRGRAKGGGEFTARVANVWKLRGTTPVQLRVY